MLITFEGVDGSGKTTQVDLLYNYLMDKGYKTLKTREPGGTAFGEALRKSLLQHDIHVFPLSELLVLMAMRAQHVEELIGPALQDGKIVICDRFTDATYAYQGYGRGMDQGIILTLNRLVTKGIRPNLTVLLDCKVEEGFKRKVERDFLMDRFEKEALSFHNKVKAAYAKLSEEEPERFFVVNGSAEVEEVQKKIRDKVGKLLKSYGI
ncbi:MAG: dTMP kinase [Proteobacteria bacterium]|nr:dTMP kinase [Pseudomonadota bacterium]